MGALLITPLAGSDTILQHDPLGGYVSLLSIVVVMVALVVLYFLIHFFGKAMVKTAVSKAPAVELPTEEMNNGEIIAAIALALKMEQEDRHDRESEVITLNKVARAYSPWSSKIHGLTQMPK